PTSARTGTIYRVTRLRTGQFYIGLTVCYVGQRWAFHVRAAKAGQATKFAAAVRADGPEGFVVDVLEQGIVGSEKLAEREKYWTEKLGSFGDMGLNTAPAGGLGGPRGISTEVNGEVFVSKNEAAQVLGARFGIAPHVVRSRLVQGQPVPDPSSVRKHSPHPEAGGNLFRRWLALLRRHPSAVVSRWLSSYDDFKADVSPAPGGHALVRKNDLNRWGPSNFEWLNNQARVERSHGTAVSVLGIPYPSLTAVSTIFGIGVSTLKNRIYRQGMSIDDAVRRPLSVTSYRRSGAEILIDNQTFRSKRQVVLYLATTRGWTENQAKYRFSIGAYGHRL
ncbi:GIY-YIG nuclease family protein, partial [Roseateles sp. GG27B]